MVPLANFTSLPTANALRELENSDLSSRKNEKEKKKRQLNLYTNRSD